MAQTLRQSVVANDTLSRSSQRIGVRLDHVGGIATYFANERRGDSNDRRAGGHGL